MFQIETYTAWEITKEQKYRAIKKSQESKHNTKLMQLYLEKILDEKISKIISKKRKIFKRNI